MKSAAASASTVSSATASASSKSGSPGSTRSELQSRDVKRALFLFLAAGCTEAKSPHPSAEVVFDAVAPSVVAIVNDDTQDREEEIKELERLMGKDPRAPKHVIDVSLRMEL